VLFAGNADGYINTTRRLPRHSLFIITGAGNVVPSIWVIQMNIRNKTLDNMESAEMQEVL
jgi:hypothetical protein